jgi:hypothetical protein
MQVASKPAPSAKQPSAAAARGADSSPQQQQQLLPLVLGGQPLVPAMLNQIVLKFSPRRAAAVSAGPAANGKLTMAQMMHLKKAASGAASAEQEQEDAQVGVGGNTGADGEHDSSQTQLLCSVVVPVSCQGSGYSKACSTFASVPGLFLHSQQATAGHSM